MINSSIAVWVLNAKLNDSQSHVMNEKALEHQYLGKDVNWILFPVYEKYKVTNYMTLFIINRYKNVTKMKRKK